MTYVLFFLIHPDMNGENCLGEMWHIWCTANRSWRQNKTVWGGVWVNSFVSANERLLAITQIFKYLLWVNIHYKRYGYIQRIGGGGGRSGFNVKCNCSAPLSPPTTTLIYESCLLKWLGICPRLINVVFAKQIILKNKPKLFLPCWRSWLRLPFSTFSNAPALKDSCIPNKSFQHLYGTSNKFNANN